MNDKIITPLYFGDIIDKDTIDKLSFLFRVSIYKKGSVWI